MKIWTGIFIVALCISAVGRGEAKMMTAQDIITRLSLKPHVEGGFYSETYRSETYIPSRMVGLDGKDTRHVSTAIYFLVTPETFSVLHRVKSDEIFHFYSGDPIEMIQIDPQGNISRIIIGSDIMNGEQPQVLVPKDYWQALKLRDGGSWGLMGTTVSPGFEYEDFEIGSRSELINSFPQVREDIVRYTREKDDKASE